MLAPEVFAYTGEKHPKSDRNMAMGCVAEVFASCEAAIPQYFNDFLAILQAHSHTTDAKLNRNVSYSVGVLAQHAQLQFKEHVPAALALLERLNTNSSTPEALDNVMAASCRIIHY